MPRGPAPPKGRKRSIAQIQSMQKAKVASMTSAMGHLTSGIVEKPVATQAGGSVHLGKEPTLEELVEKLSLRDQELLEKDVELLKQGVALQTANILLDKTHDSV